VNDLAVARRGGFADAGFLLQDENFGTAGSQRPRDRKSDHARADHYGF
jgi:hypothetical protein